MPKNPNEPNQEPQDTEFAEEQTPVDPYTTGEKKQAQDFENKDARGGNHNPEGANQYTSGRHDDRGRKEDDNQRENKGRK
jgi:hypothetical protein